MATSSRRRRMGSSALILVLVALLIWAAHTIWIGQTMRLPAAVESSDADDNHQAPVVANSEADKPSTKKPSKNRLPGKPPKKEKPHKEKKGSTSIAASTRSSPSSIVATPVPAVVQGREAAVVQRRAYYEQASGEVFAPVAYLLIISNEDFLDGALVLGVSLKMNCPRIAAGTADLAIIITQGRVSRASQERLKKEAGFNKIFEVPSLATRAPGAYWKDTFDKIYMFNLTMYQKIVFMDADMINIRSMDALFDKNYGDSTYVGAIGFRGGAEGPYFQTGMMVIQPTREMFDKIYARFESGVPPKGNNYNHGMNGRDGVLLRDVFGDRFKMIDNKYSRNLNPRWPVPDYVVSLHLRGKIKPWFDRKLPNLDPELGKKEFGHPYVLFWDIYEEQIHKLGLEYQLALRKKPLPEPFGGTQAGPDISPLTHVWMMRYSKKEYVQLLTSEDKRRRNHTVPGLQYMTGQLNASCVEVCATQSMQCHHKALSFSHGQDCNVLLQAFPECVRCEAGVYWRPHPGSDYPGLDAGKKESVCKYNLLHDERGRPNCTARYETARRFCPCVPANSCPGASCDAAV
ncbi:glycosyltransferase family 8, putative [Bodo saltans]|uniref:Glycosyltransferase family 8, putative n=1 Tax=Bodo saltans TaxID=75058 RepID=A0A0S4KEQ3_BODSA|nr:glycosyltransferase family 8, putative [Bodo saltans]|eukprot:CUI14171.1 glycosyltransferase family 8, putative [Bodo saltans]